MDWQTLRNQFMRDIGGDPPGSHLEDTLIDAYADHPELVQRSFEKITLGHKAGKIRSPWGALKTEVEKVIAGTRNPTHEPGTKRDKAIQRAEQWMRTAGMHYDRESEIEDELFGVRGMLQEYIETKPRILELYRELRPVAETSDAEREQFYAKRKAQRQ
jgi:hypothetical protein